MTDSPPVRICATPDVALLAIARATLDQAGIKYMVKNERLQNMLSLGTLGLGYNPVTGPAELFVLERDADKAHELLDPLFPS